ncbi:hypothetical protein [Pleomorphochaeta sp. DL1XJH-081]|uniref:hypothetical protein n=1 Tax=Pleomorphochaeta sp. DL1XJH-081 TaxID=3409690 RepID=UPI003BB588CA
MAYPQYAPIGIREELMIVEVYEDGIAILQQVATEAQGLGRVRKTDHACEIDDQWFGFESAFIIDLYRSIVYRERIIVTLLTSADQKLAFLFVDEDVHKPGRPQVLERLDPDVDLIVGEIHCDATFHRHAASSHPIYSFTTRDFRTL